MKAIPKKIESIVYPLDKLNFNLWQGLESKKYNVGVEKQGSTDKINIYFTPKFFGDPMNAYDKRVYLAVCALYEAGNERITAGMIYRAMGGKGYQKKKDYEKLKQSVEKMAVVRISINNEQEAIKYKYRSFCITNDYLLNCSSVEKIELKGGKSDYSIHIFEKPVLMRYAEEHKQITTYTPEQFKMPLSMTEMNCAIDDYFRYRIARASGNSVKILLKTLFEYCNISDRRIKDKAKKRFDTFLKFYAEVKLIQGYTIQTDAKEEYISISL